MKLSKEEKLLQEIEDWLDSKPDWWKEHMMLILDTPYVKTDYTTQD